jgi:hypothetical protein
MKRLSASSCFTSGDRDLSSVNGSHLGLHRIKDSAHSWLLFQARDVRAVGARLCMRGSHELPITHGELSVTHDTTIYYQSIKKASQAMCQLLTAGITRPVVSINKHVGCKFGAEKASTCHRIGSHGRQGQWNYLAARREAGRSGQGAIEVPTVIDSDHLTTHHQAVRRPGIAVNSHLNTHNKEQELCPTDGGVRREPNLSHNGVTEPLCRRQPSYVFPA